MNATGCISGQNKMIVFYSGSESSMPWEGVKGLMFNELMFND